VVLVGPSLEAGVERSFLLAPLLLLLLLHLERLLLLLLLLFLLLMLLLLLLLLWLPRCLAHPLPLLLLFLLLLAEGSEASGPGSPSRDERGLRLLLLHRVGVPRCLITTRRVADGDGVRLDPQSGRLGGSFFPLSLGRLVTSRRHRNRLGTRWSTLSVGRRLRVRGAYEMKNKGRSL